jgi:L-seryl-tRNA(Ser) seleniumtransferase
MKMPKVNLSAIPSVDAILQLPSAVILINTAGRELAVKAIRQSLDQIREKMLSGIPLPDIDVIIKEANRFVMEWMRPSLFPVINASGIILHTNLGRAPLSDDTIKAMQGVSASYNNLEFDLQKGKRGKRSIHAEEILKKLTGAESALVVNNNAAAVLLILSALAKRKKVIIPNSQLVEIGGGFRVPDVMRQSGAKLISIGTTNRIHLSDYIQALEDGASLVLNAHHSNFKIVGFTTEPKLKEVIAAAHSHSVPFVYDLGSGALIDTSLYGLAHEPTVFEAMSAGADMICFSGDKLLGGPQAGIIIGRSELMEKVKRHPLARAVRADKTCLSGISTTLTHYLKGKAEDKIPIWKMIALDEDTIRQKAEDWKKSICHGNVIKGNSMVGGGSLPGENLPTYLLALDVPKANKFLARLRALPFPIIARIENGQALFDPRTVLPNQEDAFLLGLKKALLNEE